MTTVETRARDDDVEADTASALYAYGVVWAETGRDAQLHGLGGAPVREVVHADLAVLVSPVEPPVRAKRRELLSHTEVLNAAIAAGAVVPLRFGYVFPDEETLVAEFLRPRADELKDLLREVA